MKLTKYLLCLISSFVLLCTCQSVSACGFYETESEYQALLFRARLPQMACMQPFTYTMGPLWGGELNSDPNEADRLRNCNEWLNQCDKTVKLDDIYTILYKTDSYKFISFFELQKHDEFLKKNTFCNFLVKAQSKQLQLYVLFAKAVEMQQQTINSKFEDWDDNAQDYYDKYITASQENEKLVLMNKKNLFDLALLRIKQTRSSFLKQRYAFQLCRLSYELQTKPTSAEIFDKYFGNIQPNNLMSAWSCLYKAHALSGREANLYFIKVFNACDEKKFRCVQLFVDSLLPPGMNKAEWSTYYVMSALHNPGRALGLLKNTYKYNPQNPHLAFLILREINKVEDWLITPLFYEKYSITNDQPFKTAFVDLWSDPSDLNSQLNSNENEYGVYARSKNAATDLKYLKELKNFTLNLHLHSAGDLKDFYAIALAHICLLQENATEAQHYLSLISHSALPSIELQKKLEIIWLAIKTKNVHSPVFEKIFMDNIIAIEHIKSRGINNNQTLYTLTLSLANEYLKKGDVVRGNLMRIKSDNYRYCYGENNRNYDDNLEGYPLEKVKYFDENATTNDIDKLISILLRRDKTSFEKYLCNKTTTDVNWYKEIKGTIAFRQNDLLLAKKTFVDMPSDFWKKNETYFEMNLNENPMIPKGLKKTSNIKFKYQLNKANLVKSIIYLEQKAKNDKTKSADYYNQLGNLFFNTSYWGNTWMMMRYSWSCDDRYYSRTTNLPPWMQEYMMAERAQKYYKVAYNIATTSEQKAYASLMLHYINRLNYRYRKSKTDKQQAILYGNIFLKYNFTKTFKTYDCPGIEKFIK